MSLLLTTINADVLTITFNRIAQHNAFDEYFLQELHTILKQAHTNENIKIIVLKANGKHFSAGADLNWMQRTAHMNAALNLHDAQQFAQVMFDLANSPKITIAIVHGKVIGGGVGLVAACDLVIAACHTSFSCPEVKIGLIPAVISPYVIKAIGIRATQHLFLTGATISAQRAYELQLVHHCIATDQLMDFSNNFITELSKNAPGALLDTKQLIHQVSQANDQHILKNLTANLLATRRQTYECQQGIQTLLTKWKNSDV